MTDPGPGGDEHPLAPRDDLWAAATGQPPLPPPPPGGPSTPGAPPPNRRPAWLPPTLLGAVVVLAVVLLVVLLTRDSDEASEDTSPPVTIATTVADTTVPPTPAPTTTTTSTTTTTEAPTTTTTVAPTPGLPAGLALTQAAADGVHALSGSDDQLVAAERVQLAFAVGDGSFVVQNRTGRFGPGGTNSPADTEIRRIGTVNAIVVPAQTGQWNRLHDVEQIGGRPVALVSIDRGSTPEDTVEELFLVDLDTGERRLVATIGGWEAGTARLHLADGLIVGEWSSEAVTGPLLLDFDGNPAIDPASVGLEEEYVDCADCPRRFAVSSTGDRLAWVERGIVVVYDLPAGRRAAEFSLGSVPSVAVDAVEIAGDAVVLNPIDTASGEALAPVVLTGDGAFTPLDRRGTATID